MSLEIPISRRAFVSGAAAVAAGPLLVRRDAPLPSGVFSLGVASGDPLPDAVVIWTRLAPEPVAGGGMPAPATRSPP